MEMARNRTGTPVLWCLAAAALFGASTPASKWLLDAQVGPLTLAGLLYLGAALATAPFALRGGSPGRRREPENLRRLGGAILFGGILGPVALLLGLGQAPAATVALWLNLETTATALLAWAFFREHMRARDWGANLLVVLAGVLLAAPDGFSFAPAALLVVVACTCWGLDNNFTALIDGYTPAQTTLAKGAVAGAFNLALGLFFEGSDVGVGVLALALVVGAAAYGFSIVLYIAGAQQLGASRSQMLFATAPFVGTTIAWAVLSEPVLPVQVAAGCGIALALGILFTGEHGHRHLHPPLRHTHPHRHDDGHHHHSHEGRPADAWHTHEHEHAEMEHSHPHQPDLHHRHDHD